MPLVWNPSVRPLLAGLVLLTGCAPKIPPPAAVTPQSSAPATDRYTGLILKSPRIPDDVTGELRRLNEQLSSDLDPRENAAVWLVQALGPEVFPEALRPDYFEMLGIEALSPARGHFRSVEDFIASRIDDPERRGEQAAALAKTLGECERRPWTADQAPLLAEYLESVADPLETALDGMRKPRYFVPHVSRKPAPNVVENELFLEHQIRPLVRVMIARAQLRAATGNVAAALDDMIAVRRFGILTNEGGFCIHELLAPGYESLTYYPEWDWIEGGRVEAAEARRHLEAIRGLPPVPPPGKMFDTGERAVLLDGIAAMKAGTWHSLDITSQEAEKKDFFKAILAHPSLDWDVITSSALEEFDQVRDAMNDPDRPARQRRIETVAERLDSWREVSPMKVAAASLTVSSHPAEASRTIGRTIALFAMPAYFRVLEGRDRQTARVRMREVSLALLIFRQEHGAYPDSLAELAPEFFPTEPLDPYTGRSLTYRKTGPDSCRLWSWGENGIDDGGRPYDKNRTVDDWPVTLGGPADGDSPVSESPPSARD